MIKSILTDVLKLGAITLGGLTGAALPLWLAYTAWSWCMAQIPVGLAWTGLAKIGVTVGLLLVGGSATVAATILLGMAAAALIVAIVK